MNAPPTGLRLYRAMTAVLGPLAGPILSLRARAGKEDTARLGERFGHASAPRPSGPLVWLHGASVGETRVLLSLQRVLQEKRPDLSFLFTSGTRTSAGLVANPPARSLHQYIPIDRPDAAARFVAHWRPDLGIFAEGEIWPNLIETAAQANVRLALVNARMSEKSLVRWRKSPAFAARIFGRFSALVAADARTAAGLSGIVGRSVPTPGNLKRAAPAPTPDAQKLAALHAACGDRPVWLAASTHPGEDEIALKAHALLRATFPDALLIIAPRHPERGEAIARRAGDAPRRALSQPPSAAPVYIADTMGELATFYALAPVALIGGSLLPHLRGHNPVEPAQLDCAIVAGPNVDSFADVYADLREVDAYLQVANAAGIAAAVTEAWSDPQTTEKRKQAAFRLASDGEGAMAATLDALMPLLPGVAHAAA